MALHATFFVNLRTEDEAYDQTTGSLSRALWCRWQQKGSSLPPLRLLSLVLTADQTTGTLEGPPSPPPPAAVLGADGCCPPCPVFRTQDHSCEGAGLLRSGKALLRKHLPDPQKSPQSTPSPPSPGHLMAFLFIAVVLEVWPVGRS